MYDDIGRKIAEQRRAAGLSQRELARRMTDLGESISDKALSKWEKGMTLPSSRQLLLLCRALEVDDISGLFMDRGLGRGLNAAGQRKLAEYAELLRRSGLYDRPENRPTRPIRLYTISASAGPGQYLDDGDFQWIQDPDAPGRADFAVCVAGDSMEPRYHHGQRVYIQSAPYVADGETGLFYWEGNAYIKILWDRPEGVRLHSLNPAYEDILIHDPAQLRVFGRVL